MYRELKDQTHYPVEFLTTHDGKTMLETGEVTIGNSIDLYVKGHLTRSIPVSKITDIWFGCRHRCFKPLKVKLGFLDNALTIESRDQTLALVMRKNYSNFVKDLRNLKKSTYLATRSHP